VKTSEKTKTVDPTLKTLMDWSREGQDKRVYDSAMSSANRMKIGALLRIAQGVERLVELQDRTATATMSPAQRQEFEEKCSKPFPVRKHGRTTPKRARAGN
jgi:hypothetical protein